MVFFFSSRRRHTRYWRDWSSDVCSSDLPRFDEIRPRIRSLVEAFGDRVVFTRFVVPDEPTGAWADYYAKYDYFTQAHAIPLFQLSEDPGDRPVVDSPTFGKWVPEVAELVGNGPLKIGRAHV